MQWESECWQCWWRVQWLSLTIAVQVWLATKGRRLDGTTRPWAFLSLPGIVRVGALALYHNQMCLEHLYYYIVELY